MNTRVECQAQSLDDQGAGVAELALRGRALRLHVPGLLPGERARVEVQHVSPHRPAAFGEVLSRRDAAPERVQPVCGGYGRCGGCVLQHLSYASQLAWKTERLRAALADLPLGNDAVTPCVPAPEPFGYRSRAKLVVAPPEAPGAAPGAPLRLGAYRPRSHDFVALRRCAVITPGLAALCDAIAVHAGAAGLRGYDEPRGEGELRYVLLRESAIDGGQQVSLVFSELPEEPRLQALVAALTTASTDPRLRVQGIVLHRNQGRGNVLLPAQTDEAEGSDASEDRLLFGEPALWDQVGPARLRFSPRSFSQVQRPMAALLYQAAAAFLTEDLAAETPGALLDLYCGVGGIGLCALALAPRLHLLGIEVSADAVADAQASAAAAGVSDRARFLRGDAAALLAQAAGITRAVVNPPRAGCGAPVLAALVALRPQRLAYVSCDPESLSRDLRVLCAAGYRIASVAPHDMHPHTPHVESLALLDLPA